MLLDDAGQRGTTCKSASPSDQSKMNSVPCFSRCAINRPRILLRPLPRPPIVCFGPRHDLLLGERRKVLDVSDTSLRLEQLGEGASSQKAAPTTKKSTLDAAPILTGRTRYYS